MYKMLQEVPQPTGVILHEAIRVPIRELSPVIIAQALVISTCSNINQEAQGHIPSHLSSDINFLLGFS